jgi:alpha-beta hydrolase superfamily lysophospholipase
MSFAVLGLFFGIFLILSLSLSFNFTLFFFSQSFSQSDVQVVKYRSLTLDLGNGITTKAQLSYPALGKGPFPGVLLIPGSGIADKNETIGVIHKNGPKPPTPLWQIAQYLSERGFAVLRYDKRGVSENHTILDKNVWGNVTANDLIQDSKKALNVLIQQPEVDPKGISIIGHSEGTLYAPRVAIDYSIKVKNIILMGTLAQNPVKVLYYYQVVSSPSEYAKQILDKNQTGMISINKIATDPLLKNFLVPFSVLQSNNTKDTIDALIKEFGTNGYISIDKQLKPSLIKKYENLTDFNSLKCNNLGPCPMWWRSVSDLEPNLSIIGNVSKYIGILILNGENDYQTPVQQAFLLQQRLTDIGHPDHTLITYPNLGHLFYPSSIWQTGLGPIQSSVLADLYSWLESHSGFTPLYSSIHSSNSSSSSNFINK